MTPRLTHADLVDIAGRWLLNTRRCAVVITEMASGAAEQPDAIGWRGRLSTLIECKTSRSDFLVDHKKHFRRRPAQAMGSERFYLAPDDLLKSEEMPDDWGLLCVKAGRVYVRKQAPAVQPTTRCYEVELLTSALRRMIITPGVVGVNCRVYSLEEACGGKSKASVMVGPSDSLIVAQDPK